MEEQDKTMDEVFFQKDSVEVTVGDKTFEITTLVRKQYSSILELGAQLAFNLDPKILDNIDENIGPIAQLVNDELLLKIYTAVLEQDEEWINNNMTLSQEIELLTAIFETNDVEELIENFTKALKLIKQIICQKQSQSQK